MIVKLYGQLIQLFLDFLNWWKFDYGWIEKKTQDNFFETDDSIIIVNQKNINLCPIIELRELSLCFTKEYKELRNHDFKFDLVRKCITIWKKLI